MEYNNNSRNHFLLLGRTGVGKSTLSKILSDNASIKIGDNYLPETKNITSYESSIGDFQFSIIDTPGYDDSENQDEKNYNSIKEMISSQNYKIKGIFLLFSFQEPKFSDNHRRGLQKIINLVPLDNFWDYFTIIFTKTFCDEDEDLEEIKNSKLKNLQKIFEPLISAYNKTKNIKIINFSEIKKIFVNLKKDKTKKTDESLSGLLNVLKKNSKLPPLFHKLEIEGKQGNIFILDKNDKNMGKLYECKFNIYKYFNDKNKIIKRIALPNKEEGFKYIKEIKKTEFDGKFQKNCAKVIVGSMLFGLGLYSLGLVSAIGSIFFPPLGYCTVACILGGLEAIPISFGTAAVIGIKDGLEYIKNREFNNQKIVIEEDIINEILNDDEKEYIKNKE